MKNIFVILVCIFCIFKTNANNIDFNNIRTIDGLNYILLKTSNTAKVTYGDKADNSEYVSGEIVIPETIVYNNVKYVVTGIGERAFEGCVNLESINFPNSLKTIDGSAFKGCVGIENISLPDAITSIGENTFEGCFNLKTVSMGDKVKSIGESAFEDCKALEKIYFSSSLESIGKSAFYKCESLTSVDIPESLKSAGPWAFSMCEKLKRVNITDLEAWCKINYEIVRAGFPGNPLTNHGDLYLNGKQITTLEIPESIDMIYPGTFTCCNGLKKVIMHDGVTKVGDQAFASCYDLEEVIFGNSVAELGYETFSSTGLKTINLPESLEIIGESCFNHCKKAETVYIPSSVHTVGHMGFNGCQSLKGVYINDLESWCKIDWRGSYGNPLYDAHHLYVDGEELTHFELPPSITQINRNLFKGCDGLQSVSFHNSLTTIGPYAFEKCKNLKRVVIPSSVTDIENYAFCDCPSLEEVILGSGITYLGIHAFSKVERPSRLDLYITAAEPPVFNYADKDIFYSEIYEPWVYGAISHILETSHDKYIGFEWFPWYPEKNIKVFAPLTDFSASVSQVMGSRGDAIEFSVNFTPLYQPLDKVWFSDYDPDAVKIEWNEETKKGKIIILDGSIPTNIRVSNLYPTLNSFDISVNGGAAVEEIERDPDGLNKLGDIYNYQGVCLKRNATQEDIDNLLPGLYIVNGKRILVR